MFDSPLKQVQGAGGGAPVVVVDDLRKLVGQLTGKGYFIRLPHPAFADLLKAQHPHDLSVDADAGVQHGIGVVVALGGDEFAGARVAVGVVCVD